MEKIFEVEIEPLDRDYLQYLVFEKNSYSNILSYILLVFLQIVFALYSIYYH